MAKSETISFRLEPEESAKFRKLADDRCDTVANLSEEIVRRYLAGELQEPSPLSTLRKDRLTMDNELRKISVDRANGRVVAWAHLKDFFEAELSQARMIIERAFAELEHAYPDSRTLLRDFKDSLYWLLRGEGKIEALPKLARYCPPIEKLQAEAPVERTGLTSKQLVALGAKAGERVPDQII